MNSRSRFFSVLRRTGTALFLFSLASVSVQHICAQPGGPPITPQQIRNGLEAELAEIEKQLVENPDAKYLYEVRGKVLIDLFRKSEGRIERDSFADRAFADFDTYELLTKGSALLPRAELHKLIWWSQVPDKGLPDLPSQPVEVDAFRNSPHFEAAVSGYLEIIRLRERAKSTDREDEWLRDLYATVSSLYSHRARVVAGIPEAVRTMNDRQLIWSDFDQAAEHRKNSIDALTVVDVAEIYVEKGQTAYALGEYEIALDAYQAADDYMDHNWERHCKYHGAHNCAYWKKGYVDRVSLLRAQAYLKQSNHEKVVSLLDYYLTGGPASAARCSRHFLMRAHANRKLGRIELARADEMKASQVSPLGCN